MRILVIGAGKTGAQVIRQLRKNPDITIITADPRKELAAVDEGVIEEVDIREALTPLTLEHVLARAHPDLVLLAMPTEDMGLGKTAGMDLLVESLREEIAALSRVPVIEVARVVR
jgi:predicted dinucleotide-binding enzyme